MKKQAIIVTFAILFIVLLLATIYFYIQYSRLQTASKQNEDVAAQLIAKVQRHILLPEGEIPTVMTVTDREKLSGQVFFSNAKNGDKVLIYEKEQKAFLYDVVADRIIEVGPVTLDATPAAAAPQERTYRFVLYNGTQTVGFTKTYEMRLKEAIPDAIIVDRDNAKKNDYEKSMLIDITGSKADQAKIIAEKLKIDLVSLPAGEVLPATASAQADFLIIVGADKK